MVWIHDKSPEARRKMKEGPKAQEAYVEGLHNEWIGGHTLTKEKAQHSEDLEYQVPGAVREHAERCELETLDKLRREKDRDRAAGKRYITRDSGLIVPGCHGF